MVIYPVDSAIQSLKNWSQKYFWNAIIMCCKEKANQALKNLTARNEIIAPILDKRLGTLCISGAFSKSHRSNPSSHPTNNVGRECFSDFQLCIELGEGEVQENFEKGALFYEGTEK